MIIAKSQTSCNGKDNANSRVWQNFRHGQKDRCKIFPQSQSHWNRTNKGLLLSMISGFLFPVSHLRKGQMWNISRVVGCAFDWRVKPTELLLNLHSMERKANLPYFKFLSPQPLEQFPKSSPHFLPKLRSASGVQHWHLRSKLRWVGGPSIDIIWWGGKYKRTLFSQLRKGAIWNPGLATITCHFSHFVPAISL